MTSSPGVIAAASREARPTSVRDRVIWAVVVVTLVFALGPRARSLAVASQPARRFAADIAALSEAGGFFDTDNLISNEASYLQVIPALGERRVRGGAYLGVGPDQNYAYIATIRPSIAFIVDIRRDNLLLHLLFKALFAMAADRTQYLSLLLGRPLESPAGSASLDIEAIVDGLNRAKPDEDAIRSVRDRVDDAIRRIGVPLTDADLRTIDRFHRRFIDSGFDLRFQSTGRPPRAYYPTYRDLLLARDPTGRRGSFLATDDAFQFLKALHARDLIVPVVGDVSGPKALAAIGRLVEQRKEQVSAVYVSNVEFYLFAGGSFARYLVNVRNLPLAPHAVVIRSAFGQYASGSGYSSSHLQSITELLRRADSGRIRRYSDLLTQ